MRKPAFCICVNKDTDQLRGNREADQRLCFRYIASTMPLLPKYKISSLSLSSKTGFIRDNEAQNCSLYVQQIGVCLFSKHNYVKSN